MNWPQRFFRQSFHKYLSLSCELVFLDFPMMKWSTMESKNQIYRREKSKKMKTFLKANRSCCHKVRSSPKLIFLWTSSTATPYLFDFKASIKYFEEACDFGVLWMYRGPFNPIPSRQTAKSILSRPFKKTLECWGCSKKVN